MWPGFEIHGFFISSFGFTLALAFLVGTWITAVRMHEEGLDPELASTLMLYVLVGGIVGAKLYFAVDTWLRGEGPFFSLLFSRAGITWYGGFAGALLLGALGCRFHKVSVKTVCDCGAVGLAVGHAIGRVGCFLVGDDYGKATTLPWGVSFPRGAPPVDHPVQPTQLYEIAWLLPVAVLLWRRRHRSPFLFGEFLVLGGLGRFVIEFWRVNPRVALGMTEPQWIGLAIALFGVVGWIYYRAHPAAAPA